MALTRRRAVSPRKSPCQQRSHATVESILTAAAQVFQKHGYAAGTTNRIAERAGVSIGTVYEYFPSKDAILVALARQHLEEGRNVALAMLREELSEGGIADFLRRVVTAMIRLHEQNPRLHRVLFEETPLPTLLRNEISEADHALVSAVTMLLASRPDVHCKDPALAAYFVVHLVEAMTHRYVLHTPPDCGLARFVEELVFVLARYLGVKPE